MGRKLCYVLAALALLSGAGFCAYVMFFKSTIPGDDPNSFQATGTVCDLASRVSVPLNRGAEVEDGFRGDVHPSLRNAGEVAVAATWKFDQFQDNDTAFPRVPHPCRNYC